ncbi:GntR family transcriptional regulator [Mycetocola tolaasinivorans]|uniref:GntR family transcriptional regulator n=1 Tax=Mycetocola tolaasinivorans TaxID=76635 RepID=A0A3L7AC76_9MICO|nr:GntR family transcriptional regulator [Mycetocola tolaasinivorans]RLP77251.1 GntR family transcriptional regulator [Mycetocola tolaasinivorans]
MHPLLPQRPAGLGNQIADVLRRQIVTQELPSGALLVEEKLAADFSVSRGPIRDAIKILVQEGLAATTGRSASVVGLVPADIDELFTLRTSLELLAMKTAVRDHPGTLATALEDALGAMTDAVERRDPDAFTRADLRFHSASFTACGHRRLGDVWAQYQPTIENLLLVANLDHVDLAPSLQSHLDLRDLILAGNEELIAREIESHLDNSRVRVRREYTD